MRTYLFFVSLIFFITGNIEAKTIRIPADYSTIQTGIDSAVSGDVVLVSKGTYSGGINSINMKGGIHLKSEEGPESTIISGGYSVIKCIGLTDTVLIDGFTISDGSSFHSYGGGIYSDNSNIIIRNNIIRDNTLDPAYNLPAAGGGIFVYGGSALIENNIIKYNSSEADNLKNNKKSAGMLVKEDGNNLQGDISKYYEAYGGGGIYAEATIITIKNNVIAKNNAIEASPYGGGIECVNCIKAVIFNNLIDSNYACNGWYVEGFGMGIECSAPVEIINNTIVNNYYPFNNGDGRGGGIFCWGNDSGQDSIIIKNNIIAYDSAITGGGIYCDSLAKVFIGYNGFYLNNPDNFHNAPQGVGNFSWGTNRNGNACDSFYNINIDPGFTSGTLGNYYQQNVSGCGDYIVNNEFLFLGGNTTDGKPDTGWVDLGYHYGTQIGVEEKADKKNLDFGFRNLELKIIKGKIYLSVPNNYCPNALITIYDLCGRLQSTVYSGTLTKGNYTFTPNIKKSGVYFVRLTAGNIKETKKLILMK
ncbi:MAG: T9SS type A sorting domain-containing protein [bacterium]|nr:T9SS type A sorting domain-containing protein [bacterium]